VSNSQLTGSPDALTLAKEGDPNAIAALLNQFFNPNGIFVRVGSHGNCLGILLESAPVPNQDEMITAIRHIFADLKPESIKFVKVGGYQLGQNLPVWYEEIELAECLTITESSHRAASVESWLSQGLEPIGGYKTIDPQPGILLPQSSAQLGIRINIPPNSNYSNPTQALNERRFLRFYINGRETALLPLSHVQQVIKVPVMEILPVPHMPDCVMGIYTWRGEMLWLVDLAQQLGFPSPLTDLRASEAVNTIVIQGEHTFMGVVVPRATDIETHNMQQLQPPIAGLFSTKLLSCMQGYFVASSSPVLNAKALIQDPLLQVHCPR
jgi:chemotaxis signal transduction protein